MPKLNGDLKVPPNLKVIINGKDLGLDDLKKVKNPQNGYRVFVPHGNSNFCLAEIVQANADAHLETNGELARVPVSKVHFLGWNYKEDMYVLQSELFEVTKEAFQMKLQVAETYKHPIPTHEIKALKRAYEFHNFGETTDLDALRSFHPSFRPPRKNRRASEGASRKILTPIKEAQIAKEPSGNIERSENYLQVLELKNKRPRSGPATLISGQQRVKPDASSPIKTPKRSFTPSYAQNVAPLPSPIKRRASKDTNQAPKVPRVLESSSNTTAEADSKSSKRAAKAAATPKKYSDKRLRRSTVGQVEHELKEKIKREPSAKSDDSLKIKQEEKVEKITNESTIGEATKNIAKRSNTEMRKIAKEKNSESFDLNTTNQTSLGIRMSSKRNEPTVEGKKLALEVQTKKPTFSNNLAKNKIGASQILSGIEEKKESKKCNIKDSKADRQPSPTPKTKKTKIKETSDSHKVIPPRKADVESDKKMTTLSSESETSQATTPVNIKGQIVQTSRSGRISRPSIRKIESTLDLELTKTKSHEPGASREKPKKEKGQKAEAFSSVSKDEQSDDVSNRPQLPEPITEVRSETRDDENKNCEPLAQGDQGSQEIAPKDLTLETSDKTEAFDIVIIDSSDDDEDPNTQHKEDFMQDSKSSSIEHPPQVSEVKKLEKQGPYDGPGSKQTKLFGFDFDPSFNDKPYFEVSPVECAAKLKTDELKEEIEYLAGYCKILDDYPQNIKCRICYEFVSKVIFIRHVLAHLREKKAQILPFSRQYDEVFHMSYVSTLGYENPRKLNVLDFLPALGFPPRLLNYAIQRVKLVNNKSMKPDEKKIEDFLQTKPFVLMQMKAIANQLNGFWPEKLKCLMCKQTFTTPDIFEHIFDETFEKNVFIRRSYIDQTHAVFHHAGVCDQMYDAVAKKWLEERGKIPPDFIELKPIFERCKFLEIGRF